MMYKLWILFAALLISPVAVADCYLINGKMACIQALDSRSDFGPTPYRSLMDRMDERAAQQAQTNNLILDGQLKRQQIQMQQQQMQQQMQQQNSRSVEILKNSLLKLPQDERGRVIKEFDSFSENQMNNLGNILLGLSEDERMGALDFIADMAGEKREEFLKRISNQ